MDGRVVKHGIASEPAEAETKRKLEELSIGDKAKTIETLWRASATSAQTETTLDGLRKSISSLEQASLGDVLRLIGGFSRIGVASDSQLASSSEKHNARSGSTTTAGHNALTHSEAQRPLPNIGPRTMRSQTEVQKEYLKKKTRSRNRENDGAFSVPEGASIRAQHCSVVWSSAADHTLQRAKLDEKSKIHNEATADDDEVSVSMQSARAPSLNCLCIQQSRSCLHAIVGLGSGLICVVDLVARSTLHRVDMHSGYVSSVATVGQLCFSASFDNSVRAWKVQEGQEIARSDAHRGPVHALEYDDSARALYSVASDGFVRVWKLAEGKSSVLCHVGCIGFSLALHGKKKSLYVGLDNGNISIVDCGSGVLLKNLEGHEDMVSCLDSGVRGNNLLSASRDGLCKVWFASQCVCTYVGHSSPVYAACFVRSGAEAISAESGGAIHRWDCSTGAAKVVYRGHHDTVFVLKTENGSLLSGGREGELRLWSPTEPCEFCRESCNTGKGCQFEIVLCPNSGCAAMMQRRLLGDHVEICPMKAVRCSIPGCKVMHSLQSTDEHLQSCEFVRLPCPSGCGERPRRRNLASHVLSCSCKKSMEKKPRAQGKEGACTFEASEVSSSESIESAEMQQVVELGKASASSVCSKASAESKGKTKGKTKQRVPKLKPGRGRLLKIGLRRA